MTFEQPGPLRVATSARGAVSVVTVEGVLDSTTYRTVRDAIIKAALDEPVGVVVDVAALDIPAPSACAVFTSARWQVSRWPDVPVLLACAPLGRREMLQRNGIGRFVPIHADVDSAADFAGVAASGAVRRRAQMQLRRDHRSLRQAQDFVTQCLLDWAYQTLISAAKVIATELVCNVLSHTASAPTLRVETLDGRVTIAVDDENDHPAALMEKSFRRHLSGLEMVAALSRAWGSFPSPNGKTVWATIDAEPISD